MNVFELLKHPIFEFPKFHLTSNYEIELINHFNVYMELLAQLDDFEIHQEKRRIVNSKEILETALQHGKGVVKALKEYMNGKPYHAFEELKKMLDKSEAIFKNDIMLGEENFYRLRVSDSLLEKPSIFHAPFEKRNKISTQRYSIPGFPCLYLSDSIYTCWAELKKPEIKSVNVSRFQLKGQARLFVIPNPQHEINRYVHDEKIVEGVIGIGIDSLLMNFPLYLACSIMVKNQDDKFKMEYVIPQLLLQYVRQNNSILGIKYFSNNLIQNEYSSEHLSYNYVFPVRNSSISGYCKELQEIFGFTNPIQISDLKRDITDLDSIQKEFESVEEALKTKDAKAELF